MRLKRPTANTWTAGSSLQTDCARNRHRSPGKHRFKSFGARQQDSQRSRHLSKSGSRDVGGTSTMPRVSPPSSHSSHLDFAFGRDPCRNAARLRRAPEGFPSPLPFSLPGDLWNWCPLRDVFALPTYPAVVVDQDTCCAIGCRW